MKQTQKTAEPQRATPDHNWTLEKLAEYVKDCFKCRDDINEQMASIGRKSSVELFRAGHALHLLRDKLKADSAWEQTLVDNHIAKGTANEAIRLYYKATKLWKGAAETEVAKMTITEAKVKLGVVKAKQKPKPAMPAKPKDNSDENPTERPGDVPPKVDTMLVVMGQKLEEVVNWDRTDLDPQRLDKLARQCIKLLAVFLIKKTVPMGKKPSKKGKVQHAA